MAVAYFVTATVLCLWMYLQTRAAARKIRLARDQLTDPVKRTGRL
ncbi:hypothetical protein [Ruegeria sp. HKCCA5491]|nr:hypothetical protein [Ruegeria sp. HKCCA5491]